MATQHAKEAIAREIAMGISPAQVARIHSYTQPGLRRLIHTPEMEALIAEQKELLSLKGQQLIAKAWLAADQALDNIIKIANSPEDRKHYDACTYLIEKVWPTKTVQESSVQVSLSADLTARLVDSIEEMKRVASVRPTTPIESDLHLHEGRDAVAPEDADAAERDLDAAYGVPGPGHPDGNGSAP